MSRAAMHYLLTAKQMAQFVTDGFLLLDGLVPQELNEAVLAEQKRWEGARSTFWREVKSIREVFELPQVKGVIQSFVGVNPVYDHSSLHIVRARHLKAQEWHADSIIDVRPLAFDIQAFYFSHDAPAEMGPTLVLPGSHLRKVNTSSLARYKNIIGQRQLVAKAGTIAFLTSWYLALCPAQLHRPDPLCLQAPVTPRTGTTEPV